MSSRVFRVPQWVASMYGISLCNRDTFPVSRALKVEEFGGGLTALVPRCLLCSCLHKGAGDADSRRALPLWSHDSCLWTCWVPCSCQSHLSDYWERTAAGINVENICMKYFQVCTTPVERHRVILSWQPHPQNSYKKNVDFFLPDHCQFLLCSPRCFVWSWSSPLSPESPGIPFQMEI